MSGSHVEVTRKPTKSRAGYSEKPPDTYPGLYRNILSCSEYLVNTQ